MNVIIDELEKKGLHSIGALSKLVKISADTLRYYDEIGLVKPAFISAETGYRYYSDKQMAALVQILELKEYGFPLRRIREILNNNNLPLTEIYQNRYLELIQEKEKLQKAINKLSTKIKQQQEALYMNKSILIVDNAPFMLTMIKQIVEKEGYKIAGEAVNGIEAVEKYKTLTPDMVLLDIAMPEMDGIEVLKKIKEINSNAKVVMCSAMGKPYWVTEALMAGAADFIVKPFQSEKLLSVISGAFNNERIFNNNILKEAGEKADKATGLTQHQIDQIISCALTGTDTIKDVSETSNKANADKEVNSNDKNAENQILRMLDEIKRNKDKVNNLLKNTNYISVEIGRLKISENDIIVELGRAKHLASDLDIGSIIELNKKVANQLDVFINGQLALKGKAGTVDDKFVIEITEVVDEKNNVLNFELGNIIELNKNNSDPLDVFANEKLIAKGTAVVIRSQTSDDVFGIRISEIL